MLWILALDPVPRAAGVVGRAKTLRYDAFEPELACVAKHDLARFVNVLVEHWARLGPLYELGEYCLAALDRLVPQVIAVKFDQVEGVKEDAPVIAPVAQSVEARHAVRITGDRLAVDEARTRLERAGGRDDQWEAAGPVVPVAGEKLHVPRIAAHEHSEAVVLDLVQPTSPSGRLVGWAG